jgi:hypothetical protein
MFPEIEPTGAPDAIRTYSKAGVELPLILEEKLALSVDTSKFAGAVTVRALVNPEPFTLKV